MSGPAVPPTVVTQALFQKVGLEPIEKASVLSKQLRVLLRPTDPQRGRIWAAPGGVMQALIMASVHARWSVDISRFYFMREADLVWCWRVIFQSPNIQEDLQDIASTILSVGISSQQEVVEGPLLLASSNRNAPAGEGKRGVMPTSWSKR